MKNSLGRNGVPERETADNADKDANERLWVTSMVADIREHLRHLWLHFTSNRT
jgi:hypothetical protein